MAACGAKIAATNAMNGDARRYDNLAMAAVAFTDPQVASVDLTEATAKEQGTEVRASTLSLDNVKTGRLRSVVRTAAFSSVSGHCEWLQ